MPGTSIPTRIVTPRNQAKLAAGAVSETPPILAYLEKWFERPYPFDKLDLIAVPEFAFGAMENPGLIVFRDSILLADPTRDTPAERRNRTGVIAHELAHMWFGDVVTMEWWDDLWLNESFADWLGDRTIDELYPELEIGLRSLRELAGTMHTDSQPNAEAIRLPVDSPPEAAFQNLDIVYNKGHAVLDMVEGWLSKETFRKGVVHYINKFEWRNARGPDLWNALAEVSKQDVPAVLTTFVAQPGYPLLDFERVGARGVRVRQRRFATAGAEVTPQTWRVPILLRYADEAGVHASPVLLTEAEQTFTLPESSTAGRGKIRWFHPDADVRGYYRWRLPAATLADLAAHAGERLNVRERVALLGNLEALLQAGAIDGSTYVSLLVPFAKDSEPSVLTALADRVEALDETFFAAAAPIDRIRYAAFVRQLFGPSAHELGWRQVAGESDALRTLRPRLLGFVGEEGADAALREQARDMVNGYLASDSAHRPLDPDIAPTALRLAALDGDRALFDRLVAGFETAKVPQDIDRFLGALGSFRNARAGRSRPRVGSFREGPGHAGLRRRLPDSRRRRGRRGAALQLDHHELRGPVEEASAFRARLPARDRRQLLARPAGARRSVFLRSQPPGARNQQAAGEDSVEDPGVRGVARARGQGGSTAGRRIGRFGHRSASAQGLRGR